MMKMKKYQMILFSETDQIKNRVCIEPLLFEMKRKRRIMELEVSGKEGMTVGVVYLK